MMLSHDGPPARVARPLALVPERYGSRSRESCGAGSAGPDRLAAVPGSDEGVARMYHSAWEVREITDLVRARRLLHEARALVGASNHGVSLSLYAKDPDGLEFEIFWTVPDGRPAGTRELDLEGELARRGIVTA